MIPSGHVLKSYNLDDTTKSIWGISRSYENVFLDSDVVCVIDVDGEDALVDGDLVRRAADYLRVIAKMLDEWVRIRVTRPCAQEVARYRGALAARIDDPGGRIDGRSASMEEILDYRGVVDSVAALLEGRIVDPGAGPAEEALYGHITELLELFDGKIGLVKVDAAARSRMIHQVSLMYSLTLTRKGECAVLAGEQGYEGLITIPYRNLLSREVDHPDSPLNVLRGSRITAILPDENGKFRRNFVSSWVSPNDRVFVTVGGVEDAEARDGILDLVRRIESDLADLGFSGEKYRLDISTDRDTLEEMVGDLVQRIPKPDDMQSGLGIESLSPVWEKIAEICGVLGFHAKRDESLRHLGATRGKRFAVEIERLKRQMDEISRYPEWHSDPAKLEEFQGLQKEMITLIERKRRR